MVLVSCGSKPSKESIEAYQAKVFERGDISLPYRILLPKEFDPQKSYPLVLVLHGAGERGLDNEAQLTHGSSVFLEPENREKFPAIVVFPQCPEESYWANVDRQRKLMTFNFTFQPAGEATPAMKSLQALFDELLQNHKIDRSRIYVGGLSMGGMGTFEFVRRNPGTIAAAFAICGGAHPDTAANLTDTKWWVFHGDADMVVDYEHSVEIVNALKEQGAEVQFTTYEGVNHNSWENAFAEPDLLPWLFSNQLK
ncbi:prolyl oligopeptidase family serine peptidase [Flavobacteriaceae bacterium R33]|uniref:Prolyl oligopeptidase family serine peptidase n=2 Tax=Poritiphilus flavus TaxID=2697053 RepID=A0A6L9EAV7_9FLAO|nr:prolyl oligopeptidase family serine peptidase [Poritiphilus flavus]